MQLSTEQVLSTLLWAQCMAQGMVSSIIVNGSLLQL